MGGWTAKGKDRLMWDGNLEQDQAPVMPFDLVTKKYVDDKPAGSTLVYPLAVASGGLAFSSYTQGDLLYASANTTISKLAKDTNATRYLTNKGTSNNPKWDKIELSNGVSGALTIANGGTGGTAFGANQLIYTNSGNTALTSSSNATYDGTDLIIAGGLVVGATSQFGSTVFRAKVATDANLIVQSVGSGEVAFSTVNDDNSANTPFRVRFTAGYFTSIDTTTIIFESGENAGDMVLSSADLSITGKINATGGFDPPYVLYDNMDESEVLDKIAYEIPPSKLNGMAIYWSNNKLYGATSNDGNNFNIYEIPINFIKSIPINKQGTESKHDRFYFDSRTGDVKSYIKGETKGYKLKTDIAFNSKTGEFYNRKTKEIINKAQAIKKE